MTSNVLPYGAVCRDLHTVDRVEGASGSCKGYDPVIIRSTHHKTGTTWGPARLVLSEKGNMMFYLYYRFVRQARLQSLLNDTQYVFFNTKAIQRECVSGVSTHQLTSTQLRHRYTRGTCARSSQTRALPSEWGEWSRLTK